MGYFCTLFFLSLCINYKKMPSTSYLQFNIPTKKYVGIASAIDTLYAKIFDPAGNLILNKSVTPNSFITASTQSAEYNLPVDTSGNIVQGSYLYYYTTEPDILNNTISIVSALPTVGDPSVLYLIFDGMYNAANSIYIAYLWDGEGYLDYEVFSGLYNYLGSEVTCLEFNVSNDCNFYPNGQITAVDSTNYGNYTIDSRIIQLYFPNGLTPAPVSPYIETTTAATLVVNTLATGMWTAILTVNLSITQDDGLVILYQLKKTLNHNVACNGQLCSVNDALDQIRAAYAADVSCGSTTPRYAQELTLANAYYTQYQIERSCGDTLAAAAYAEKITNLVGQTHSSCGGSCGCSGSSCSCDTSCGCSGEDTTPTWVNNTSSESGYRSYVALMTQRGFDDPTVIILENSLGDIYWYRDGLGYYIGELNNSFPIEKTFILTPSSGYDSAVLNGGGGDPYNIYRYGDNEIIVSIGSDGALDYTPIEIRVYN
jgi:hypothetical protein